MSGGAAVKALEVLTEFRFEITGAVANSQTLAGEVGRISSAADGAIQSLSGLSATLSAITGFYLPGLGGTVMGVFGTAISSAEKFNATQIDFANIMSANRDKLVGPIDTFNERMAISGTIIKDIVQQARKFALPEGEMIRMSKLLSVQLTNKGLSGDNFGTAIDISRNLLKAAPSLGVDPQEVEGQMLRLMEGGASQQDTLFRRLTAETTAFKPYSGKGGTQKFNKLDAAERVDTLRTGLGQFTKDVTVLDARVNSLTGQFQLLKNQLTGIDSILRPLGVALREPIVAALRQFNEYIRVEGRALGQSLAQLIGPIIENPKKLLINLLQLRQLSNDLGHAQSALHLAGSLGAIGFVISKLSGVALFANPIIGGMSMAFSILGAALEKSINPVMGIALTMLKWGTIIGGVGSALAYFGFLLPVLGFALKFVLAPLTFLVTAFQMISRAVAIANVADAAALPKFAAELAAVAVRIKDGFDMLMAPFTLFMDFGANLLAPLFSISMTGSIAIDALTLLAKALEGLGGVAVGTLAVFSGAFAGLFGAIERFQNTSWLDLARGKVGIFDNFGDDFMTEYEKYMQKAKRKPGEVDSNATVSNSTHIGKIEIRQDFKENQEPDRIAHSLVKTLKEISINPTQAAGRSFSGAMTGR